MNRDFNYNYNCYPNNMDRDMNNPKFFTEREGYLRGNMFRNLYSQYKNYEPAILRPTNEQEEMFLRMSEAEFAAHDLNLYLDLYPNDGNALDLFNKYRKKANKLIMEYEEKTNKKLEKTTDQNKRDYLEFINDFWGVYLSKI